ACLDDAGARARRAQERRARAFSAIAGSSGADGCRLERAVRALCAARCAGAHARPYRPHIRCKERNMTLVRSAATIAAALAALLALAGWNTDKPPVLQGWVEADLIFVGPDEAGRIEFLNVRQGDQVALRSLLFTLDAELQQADLQVQEATLKNAQLAYERAVTLVRTNAGTQKAVEDAEAAQRTAQARLNSAKTRLERRKMFSPVEGSVEQLYFRVGEMVAAGRPVVALLPPGNVKIRFFVAEAKLPEIRIDNEVAVHCDGCADGLTAKISFISRASEFTPPVIYSLEERNKLVFMIEARPDQPEKFRVGQPVTVSLSSSPTSQGAARCR